MGSQPQITGPPATGYWRPHIRAYVNRLLAEAHAAGLTGTDALAYLDARRLRPPPQHQYQLWLKERRLARVALGLLPPPVPVVAPRRRPDAASAGQCSFLEE